MNSCETSGINICDHFREVTKMIQTGKGAHRPIRDYMLTRYACYLIAQNGDPKKEEIAFAQSYFAIQTRKQELIEERIAYIERTEARGRLRESEKRLSQNIYERGVDDAGFGRIRSKGDKALFGGKSTQDMKKKLGVDNNQPLADFLPTLTIAAKNLATEMTNYNVVEKDLQGESSITTEHIQNNSTVRDMLGQRGIKPEDLPVSEDINQKPCFVSTTKQGLDLILQFLPPMTLVTDTAFLVTYDYLKFHNLPYDFPYHPVQRCFQFFLCLFQTFSDLNMLWAMFFTFSTADAVGSCRRILSKSRAHYIIHKAPEFSFCKSAVIRRKCSRNIHALRTWHTVTTTGTSNLHLSIDGCYHLL